MIEGRGEVNMTNEEGIAENESKPDASPEMDKIISSSSISRSGSSSVCTVGCVPVSSSVRCREACAPVQACAIAPGKAPRGKDEGEDNAAPGMALAVAPAGAQDVDENMVEGETPVT